MFKKVLSRKGIVISCALGVVFWYIFYRENSLDHSQNVFSALHDISYKCKSIENFAASILAIPNQKKHIDRAYKVS